MIIRYYQVKEVGLLQAFGGRCLGSIQCTGTSVGPKVDRFWPRGQAGRNCWPLLPSGHTPFNSARRSIYVSDDIETLFLLAQIWLASGSLGGRKCFPNHSSTPHNYSALFADAMPLTIRTASSLYSSSSVQSFSLVLSQHTAVCACQSPVDLLRAQFPLVPVAH